MTFTNRKQNLPDTGSKFGNWEFIAGGDGYRWKMKCVCGVEKEVRSQDIRMGTSKSCGCISTGGKGGLKNKTHGTDYGSKLYRAWRNAKNRCFNPKTEKYKTYGAEGITMYSGWANSYEEFAAYIGEPPGPEYSLDRIENSKGYEPGNVRWATPEEQMENRACTLRISFEGVEVPLTKVAKALGIDYGTLAYRYRKGWPDSSIAKPLGYRLSQKEKAEKVTRMSKFNNKVANASN